MDSKLTFSCDGAVTNATISIKMQKRTASGTWVDVPNSLNSSGPFKLAANTTAKIMTGGNLLCVVGTFRTAGKGKATNAQGVTDSIDWYYGDPAQVTCDKK